MSNLLAFPFKKTFVIPVAQTARKYIQDNLPDSNPDAFKWDFREWEALRKRTLDDVIHVDLIQHFLEWVTFRARIMSKLISTQLSRSVGVHLDEAPPGRRCFFYESLTRAKAACNLVRLGWRSRIRQHLDPPTQYPHHSRTSYTRDVECSST